MDRSYGQLQKQEQRISTSIIQGLNMLSLPAQAMYSYLVELSMGNPMLEIPESPSMDRYEDILDKDDAGLNVIEQSRIDTGRDPAYFDGLPPELGYGEDGLRSGCADRFSEAAIVPVPAQSGGAGHRPGNNRQSG